MLDMFVHEGLSEHAKIYPSPKPVSIAGTAFLHTFL